MCPHCPTLEVLLAVHEVACKNLDHLSLTYDNTLVYFVDGIILIGPSEHEVVTTLEFLVSDL